MCFEIKKLCNLDEELRDGYLVSKEMKSVWNVQLNLLDNLISVCNANNLTVLADYGTLLGAVRHKGYIPWDDDIDVMMPREDFDKLVSISKSVFQAPIFFQYFYNDSHYYYSGATLRLDGTASFSKTQDCFKKNVHMGISIDIFPMDKMPLDLNVRRNLIFKHHDIVNFLNFRYSSRLRFFFKKASKEVYKKLKEEKTMSDVQLFEYQDSLVKNCSNASSDLYANLALMRDRRLFVIL